ncbi:MAG: transporter substrate-binding domain-containing protein, partial [Mesorhizobium sp.]
MDGIRFKAHSAADEGRSSKFSVRSLSPTKKWGTLMFEKCTCLQAVAVLAVMAGSGFTGNASAQDFDTSGIKVDPALAGRLPEKIKKAGVIVIGSDTSYAPWEYLSEKDGQTPEGIDVDIADALAAKLGVKIE